MKISLPSINFVPASSSESANYHFLMMTESLSIPDGNRATVHEMAAAQKKIQAFVTEVEDKLFAVDDDMLHDFVVAQLRELAAEYNRELKIFSARFANH